MAGYTKEFLIEAFMSRYQSPIPSLRTNAEKLYDEVGKDKFRAYATLDAAAIKRYKKGLKN